MRFKEILRSFFWFFVLFSFGIGFFVFNIIIHEKGHYVAADYYGLEPKIEYNFTEEKNLKFSFESVTIASTEFLESENDYETGSVTVMGVLTNLLLGLIFLFCLVNFKLKYGVKDVLVVGCVVSFVSFFMNALPFPGSDGKLILDILLR